MPLKQCHYAEFIFSIILIYCCIITSSNEIAKPNFVVIIADDLGIGDLGCYGNDTIRTPNIDRLANEGVKFDHALAASAVCTPSRAAILTGRYPVRSGMASSGFRLVHIFIASSGGLPESEVSFAKILKNGGYFTGLVGKWHLGLSCSAFGDHCHHPKNHGFDYFYGLPISLMKDFLDGEESPVEKMFPYFFQSLQSAITIGLITSFILGYKKLRLACFLLITVILLLLYVFFITSNIKLLNSVLMRNDIIIEQPIQLESLSQRITSESVNFITKQAKPNSPFLLLVTYTNVHNPLTPHKKFKGKSQHGLYGDSVEELDWGVGQILNALDKLNMRNNTFVVFTSDHGGHIEDRGKHGERHGGYNGIYKGGKGMAGMEGGIRVPTLISWPQRFSPGTVIKVPVSLMDIYPTIVHSAGLNLPNDRIIDGKDLTPLLKHSPRVSPHEFIFHYCDKEIHAARYIESETAVWKIHFIIPKWLPGTTECQYMCGCSRKQNEVLDNPLIYNIVEDPKEERPVTLFSLRYKELIQLFDDALTAHENTIAENITDQLSVVNSLWKPWLQPCCNFPTCKCEEQSSENTT